MKQEKIIEYGVFGGGALLLILGVGLVFLGPKSYVGYGLLFMTIGVVVTLLPYSVYSYFQYSKFKRMEDRFPRFLRDFAEAKKSGMTFPQAFASCKRADYGLLSVEIKKSSNQLSWGVSFNKVLNMLAKRLKGSKLIRRSLVIINESFSSGGDVGEVMDTLSTDIKIIKEIEKEKKSMLNQQGVVMYFIFFLFLGIIVMLARILIPILEINTTTGTGILGLGGAVNYCEIATRLCSTCSIFNFGGGQLCYFKSLFLYMALLQGVASGIIVGEISEGSIIAGVKHALIMVISTIVAFIILA